MKEFVTATMNELNYLEDERKFWRMPIEFFWLRKKTKTKKKSKIISKNKREMLSYATITLN